MSGPGQQDTTESSTPPSPADSAGVWMFRGLLLGVLIFGAANALSFFVRSRGWGTLLGEHESSDEAIGFPLLIWQEVNGYGSHQLRMNAFLIDIGAALIAGLVIGAIAIWKRGTLNQIMDRFRSQATERHVRLQFSLRSIMITTVLAALAAAVARSFVPRVEVLAAIYALGPAALIGLAFLPRNWNWQQRVAILTPATVMLIVVAIVLGGVLNVEFDKVMLGIFICWTPQAAIAATALTAFLMLREYQTLKQQS